MTTDDQVKISDDHPIPGRRLPHDKGYSEALRKLQVGQSVLLPTSRYSACALAGSAIGVGKYRTRTESGGVRIWRAL